MNRYDILIECLVLKGTTRYALNLCLDCGDPVGNIQRMFCPECSPKATPRDLGGILEFLDRRLTTM